jgi:hypothetical protein
VIEKLLESRFTLGVVIFSVMETTTNPNKTTKKHKIIISAIHLKSKQKTNDEFSSTTIDAAVTIFR